MRAVSRRPAPPASSRSAAPGGRSGGAPGAARAALLVVVLTTGLLAGCTEASEDPPSAETVATPDADATTSPPGDGGPGSAADGDRGGSGRAPRAERRPVEPGTTLEPVPPPRVSVPGLAARTHQGDRLRLGRVRERTAAYTSYDVSYRVRSTGPPGPAETLRITGVLNVPAGPGPFPAVVLAHGYIDPAVYVRGQGMTRERGYLAGRGFVALHVDYRNHAGSTADPSAQREVRLGYVADVIGAVKALRRTGAVPVDPDRIALFGRSMGGGVVQKALIAEPGLAGAAAAWASVSSLEGQNYDQFIRPDPEDAALREELARRYGLPEDNPRFWRQVSARPYFDRITEPVLLVHGRFDDTCPPRWAGATLRALRAAGVDAQLAWYDDGHAFGPAFLAAMGRTVAFFDARLGA